MAMKNAKIIVLLIVIIITVTNIAANVLSTKQGRRKGKWTQKKKNGLKNTKDVAERVTTTPKKRKGTHACAWSHLSPQIG